jgi:isopenicillin N synthase-like dioxygenase
MDHPDSTEEIPTIDIADYLAGGLCAQERAAEQLRQTSETVGFFYLRGHGIPETVFSGVFEASRRFHELPLETKMKIPLIHSGVLSTGYSPVQSEREKANINLIANVKPNLYAFFSVNRENSPSALYRAENIWPELPGFRQAVMDYHRRVEMLGRMLLPIWATSLDLPSDYFDRFFSDPQLTMSLLFYPPQREVGRGQYGIAPHVDASFMTLLAQIGRPSLAVQMPSGHWRLVDVIPGTLLVNTGRTLTLWTNDRYPSTKHRVINIGNSDRYSIAAFYGPNADDVLACVPTCQSPENPPRYPAMSFADFRKQTKGY